MDIRELQTPCFVLDEKEFENNIRDFKKFWMNISHQIELVIHLRQIRYHIL